jgi:hypothetical protein
MVVGVQPGGQGVAALVFFVSIRGNGEGWRRTVWSLDPGRDQSLERLGAIARTIALPAQLVGGW